MSNKIYLNTIYFLQNAIVINFTNQNEKGRKMKSVGKKIYKLLFDNQLLQVTTSRGEGI